MIEQFDSIRKLEQPNYNELNKIDGARQVHALLLASLTLNTPPGSCLSLTEAEVQGVVHNAICEAVGAEAYCAMMERIWGEVSHIDERKQLHPDEE